MQTVLIYSTWPDEDRAGACATALVGARAAACATLLPGALSTFRWDNAVQTEKECVLLAKTSAEHAEKARDLILKLHPYELPCVLAFAAETAFSHAPFLAWTASETR